MGTNPFPAFLKRILRKNRSNRTMGIGWHRPTGNRPFHPVKPVGGQEPQTIGDVGIPNRQGIQVLLKEVGNQISLRIS